MLLRIFVLAFSSCLLVPGNANQLHNLVYRDFDVRNFDKCALLLNQTHQVGCQSVEEGNIGIIYHVNSSDSLESFKSLKSGDYIVVLEIQYFTRKNLDDFKNSRNTPTRVEGIILYESNDFASSDYNWSPSANCPGDQTSLYNSTYGETYAHCNDGKALWNDVGDGMSGLDIPFPVFFSKVTNDSQALINCYQEHNTAEEYPLCSVQMKARMNGAVDSVTCLRRNYLSSRTLGTPYGYCDPMSGYNVIAALNNYHDNPSSSSKSILLTAPMDSRSFVSTDYAPGASLATGFISLLGVAKALGEDRHSEDIKALKQNIVFAILDGETFDNIGSLRMLTDMASMDFPVQDQEDAPKITLSDISQVVELRQLGRLDDKLWMHYDPVSYLSDFKSQIDSTIGSFQGYSKDLQVSSSTSAAGLSPSSLQVILKQKMLPGVVVTDYDAAFANKHYMSRYDTLENLNVTIPSNATDEEVQVALAPLAQKLAAVSTSTAKVLYSLASDGKTAPDTMQVTTDSMVELLFCYLYKSNCSLFTNSIPKNDGWSYEPIFDNNPLPRYISVSGQGHPSRLSITTYNVLSKFIGQLSANNRSSCEKDSLAPDGSYFFFPYNQSTPDAGLCRFASSYFTKAAPKAFENIHNYEDLYEVESSLWTESRWKGDSFSLRLFLVQSNSHQNVTLLVGVFVLVLSFVIVYFVERKSNVLFSREVAL